MHVLFGSVALFLTAVSLGLSLGHYSPVALALLVGGFTLVLTANLLPRFGEKSRQIARACPALFAAAIAVELWLLWRTPLLRPFCALIGVACCAYGVREKGHWGIWLFPIVLLLFATPTSLILKSSRPPNIDVWYFQQLASEHLLAGRNPYSESYPNIYGDDRFYGQELLVDGKIRSFPYPPLSLAIVAPGSLAGDIRWALWLALLAIPALMVATIRALGLKPGHPVELVPIAFLLYPFNLFMIREAWTETLLGLAACFLFWACATGGHTLRWVAAAGTLAIKQYSPLVLIPFLTQRKLTFRQVTFAVVAACTIAVPFLLWDWAGFLWGVIWFHVHNVFRPDALTIPAHLYHEFDWELPAWPGFAAAALVLTLSFFAPERSLSRVASWSAVTLLAFFLLNKAAFFNYYWLVLLLLANYCTISIYEINDGEAATGNTAIPAHRLATGA